MDNKNTDSAAVRALPSNLTEREQIDLLCQVETYMSITEKHSQTAPEVGAEEARIYSLVNGFIAKRFSDIGAAVRGEAVAVVDSGDDGLFVEILLGDNGSPLKMGDKLYLEPVSARAADAPSEPREMYECIGKGGEYELLGEAYGAGPAKGTAITVYRDTTSLGLFYRSVADFGKRMRRIGTMTGAPIGKSRAADAFDSQPTEADARDAARYRLLRDGGNHDYRLCKWAHSGVQVMKRLDGEELDRALDQAAADHKASWMTKATERASSQPTDGGVRNG